MSNPKILDFSAPEEEAITVIFPDGKTTVELPTADELTLPALQFLTSSGAEWSALYEKSDLTAAERKRFGHLNQKLLEALLSEAPKAAIESLSEKRKAAVILSFMTASPKLQEAVRDLIEAEQSKGQSSITASS